MSKSISLLVLFTLLLAACNFQVTAVESTPTVPIASPISAAETPIITQPTETPLVASQPTITPPPSTVPVGLLYFWPDSLSPDLKFNSTNSTASADGYVIEFDNPQTGAATVLRAGTEADRYPYCGGQTNPDQIRGLAGCSSMGTGAGAAVEWKENGVHYIVGGIGNSMEVAVQFAENLKALDYQTWQQKLADAVNSSYSSSARTRIQFITGTTSYETDPRELANGEYDEYILGALAGQKLTASISPDISPNAQDFLIVIAASEDWFLASESPQGNIWTGTLPATQDYVIRVTNWGDKAPYQLKVSIPWEIDLTAGKTSTTLDGKLVIGLDQNDYVVKAQAGQTLTVTATAPNNNACLTIAARMTDGSYIPLVNAASHPTTTWSDILPAGAEYSQDYSIAVSQCPNTPMENILYTLFVNVTGG